MAIRKLKLKADSFTLTYSITLPLPESDAQPAAPILEAQDDLGNEYLDWGGAYGPSPDGSSTHGTLSGLAGCSRPKPGHCTCASRSSAPGASSRTRRHYRSRVR